MSYDLKTLIVFDTNSLRKVRTNAKEREIIDYSNFDFGAPFKKVYSYINENKISDIIHLSIPEMVLRELMTQCERQYQKEQKIIEEALSRISEIPHKNGLALNDPNVEFQYKEFIKQKAEEVLKKYNVVIMPFDESKIPIMFNNMLGKVLDIEDVKSPFRPKDAGFKDSVIWECLLNYSGIKNYRKVIFLTKDGDYKDNCYTEFNSLWENQEIIIRKNETEVIVEITKMYNDYLEERELYDFAGSDYFLAVLNEALKEKTMITINDLDKPIRSFQIVNPNSNVIRTPPTEDGAEHITITSKIAITYQWDEETKVQEVEASTLLADEETKELISIEFDFDLQ